MEDLIQQQQKGRRQQTPAHLVTLERAPLGNSPHPGAWALGVDFT